ncbi:hypothetical protein EVAR_83094_1 [Eumeta japonica]|uniref:Uncharacterized protein n=1 Tax=Eumeta variegata TaxID=151549 RepID=A0A4C1WQ54_EUMVA|nr:hypothetical protein EVAR_83094_1 [Eumeta japonica]
MAMIKVPPLIKPIADGVERFDHKLDFAEQNGFPLGPAPMIKVKKICVTTRRGAAFVNFLGPALFLILGP